MKEICKGCKKFGIRKDCYRGCDSMPKNNLKEKPMKLKKMCHIILLFLFSGYRKKVALIDLDKRISEWFKIYQEGTGKGYIESHHLYVYKELLSVKKNLEEIL